MHLSLSVDEALERVLAHFSPLPAETVEVLDALGRVLAEDVVAPLDVPPFTNSAMDGYAVRAADTASAGRDQPVVLRVIADVAAGHAPGRDVEPGTAARIMTGAPMPSGADSVVRFEETSEGRRPASQGRGETVEIFRAVQPGDNVRQAGEDVRAGQVVLPAGTPVRPQEVGVLASLGYSRVRVHRRPRVAVLATGDELVGIDEPITPGKIRNSNEYSTAALVLRDGGLPVRLGIARDNVADLSARLREGLKQQVDLFLTSAGVSVGDYDMVKDVLAASGEMHFWQVRIKPGKPLAFGQIGSVPLLGLPGNPVAAMVAYEAFARPAIRRMLGYRELSRTTVRAVLEEDIENSGRRHYMRALLRRRDGGYSVTTRGSGVAVQGSGILTSMVWANCFLVVPEEVTFIPAGAEVDVQLLE
jgi:molybdopterin molybdotransferase